MSQPDANPPADFTVSLPDSWRAKPAQPQPAQPDDPEQRIAVIEDSLRCFTYGWLSCLPVIGVAWLYPAVRRFVQARRRKAEWNPAQGYLAAGLALVSLAMVVLLLQLWVLLCVFGSDFGLGGSTSDQARLLGFLLLAGCPPSLVGLAVALVTRWPRLMTWLLRFRLARLLWQQRRFSWLLPCAIGILVFELLLHDQFAAKLNETIPMSPVLLWFFWVTAGVAMLLFIVFGIQLRWLTVLGALIWLVGAALLTGQLFSQ